MVDINYDFIKCFLSEYKANGTPGINKIYYELYWEQDEASEYLYWHIKYMVDNDLLEGNGTEYHNITEFGKAFIDENSQKYSKQDFINKFKNIAPVVGETVAFLSNLYNLLQIFTK